MGGWEDAREGQTKREGGSEEKRAEARKSNTKAPTMRVRVYTQMHTHILKLALSTRPPPYNPTPHIPSLNRVHTFCDATNSSKITDSSQMQYTVNVTIINSVTYASSIEPTCVIGEGGREGEREGGGDGGRTGRREKRRKHLHLHTFTDTHAHT